MPDIGKDIEQQEFLFAVGEDAHWYNHSENNDVLPIKY